MILDDIKADKNINIQEKKIKKQPFLQIFFKNNQIEKINKKSINPNSPKSSKFNFSSLNINNKVSGQNKQEKNITPIKKLKKNEYLLNNVHIYNKKDKFNNVNQSKNKFNNSHLYESRNNNNKKINKNSISISLNNNNSFFPTINGKVHLFRLQKKNNTNEEGFMDEKNKQNNKAYNNINLKNYNSNSIVVTEARPKNILFQKFLGDKISSFKSINFNYINSLKNLNTEGSDLKQISNLKINSVENRDKSEKNNKNNISDNFNYNIQHLKSDLDIKANKSKSVKFNNLRNNIFYNNKPILTENNPEINEKKDFISAVRGNDGIKNLQLSIFKTFNQDKSLGNQKNKNNRKIFFMKNHKTEENNKIINHSIKPLKSDIRKNSYSINNENYKSLNYNNIKDINNLFGINNNDIINNGGDNDHFDNMKKIIKLNNKISYYDANRYLNKNEEQYFLNERAKIILKINENNKLGENYKSSTKNSFLKNNVIEKIKDNISENLEILLKIKEEKKKENNKRMQKYLMEIYYYILNKQNENHPYENIDNLGLYFFNEEPIKTKIKILNNSGFFDMYQDLIKDIDDKWNKQNFIIYKQLIDFYSFNNILNEKNKNNKSFYEVSDRKFFLYTEKLRKDINNNLNEVNFTISNNNVNKKVFHEKKTNKGYKSNNALRKTRKFGLQRSKTIYFPNQEKKNNQINHKNSYKNLIFEKIDENEGGLSDFAKIQKEFLPIRETNNFKKFTQLNRISPKKSKKKINIVNIINNNNNNIKEENLPEIEFNEASKKVENFKTLKNTEIFNIKEKKKDLGEKDKLKIKLIRTFKINKTIKKLTGREILNGRVFQNIEKEVEKEQDIASENLFNELVSIIKKKEIDKFYILLQNNENKFNEIINKQESMTGNTLLIYAVDNNLKSITEMLLIKKANPDIQNLLGNSALHIAYQNNNSFIINLLVEYNANQNLKNENGLMPSEVH